MIATLRDGCRLHVREWGQAAGPVLLWVHGFPITSEMWVDSSERLAALCPTWRILAPDLRGFGESDAVFTNPPAISTYVDDLRQVLDAAGARGAVWGGLSMGGIICFEAFRVCRPWVQGLVLSNTRAEPESQAGRVMREDRARLALERGSRAVAELMKAVVLAPDAPEQLLARVVEIMAQARPEAVAFGSRALATRADSQPTLATIDVPTLVIAGEEDRITPLAGLRAIFDAIPDTASPRVFRAIEAAGHVPPMEQPERFAAHVAAFLTQLPAD
jgi:3-oxoadipate enol-lactonase